MLRWREEGGKRERASGQVRQNMRGRGGERFHSSEHTTGGEKKSPIISHIWHAMAARFRWAKESFRGSKCAAPKRDLSYVFMIYLLGGFLEITRRVLAAVKGVEVDFLPLLFVDLNTLCTKTSNTNFKDARSYPMHIIINLSNRNPAINRIWSFSEPKKPMQNCTFRIKKASEVRFTYIRYECTYSIQNSGCARNSGCVGEYFPRNLQY